jgi:hypothetical protein
MKLETEHRSDLAQIIPGIEAPQLALELIQLHTIIRTLTFAAYAPYPGLERRLMQRFESSTEAAIPAVSDIRTVTQGKSNYWEAVLAARWSPPEFTTLVNEALRHDAEDEVERRVQISAKNLSQEKLVQMISALTDDRVLALYSNCELDTGEPAHIPMMDFRCPPNSDNLRRVELSMKAMGLRGAILESGNSYHFYGFELFGEDEWLDFMAKCLLLSPLTDSRYVAHRLLGRACVLRISASNSKPTMPFVRSVLT